MTVNSGLWEHPWPWSWSWFLVPFWGISTVEKHLWGKLCFLVPVWTFFYLIHRVSLDCHRIMGASIQHFQRGSLRFREGIVGITEMSDPRKRWMTSKGKNKVKSEHIYLISLSPDDLNVGMVGVSENKAAWPIVSAHLSKWWVTLPPPPPGHSGLRPPCQPLSSPSPDLVPRPQNLTRWEDQGVDFSPNPTLVAS